MDQNFYEDFQESCESITYDNEQIGRFLNLSSSSQYLHQFAQPIQSHFNSNLFHENSNNYNSIINHKNNDKIKHKFNDHSNYFYNQFEDDVHNHYESWMLSQQNQYHINNNFIFHNKIYMDSEGAASSNTENNNSQQNYNLKTQPIAKMDNKQYYQNNKLINENKKRRRGRPTKKINNENQKLNENKYNKQKPESPQILVKEEDLEDANNLQITDFSNIVLMESQNTIIKFKINKNNSEQTAIKQEQLPELLNDTQIKNKEEIQDIALLNEQIQEDNNVSQKIENEPKIEENQDLSQEFVVKEEQNIVFKPRIIQPKFLQAKFLNKGKWFVEKKKIRKQKLIADVGLAQRNIKLNFATGLIQYIQVIRLKYFMNKNDKEIQRLDTLLQWLYSEKNKKVSKFSSFSGWQEIWNDQQLGHLIRKYSIQFFGNDFAKIYVKYSKIKEEYKSEYLNKIKKFLIGSKNPKLFNSFQFRQN